MEWEKRDGGWKIEAWDIVLIRYVYRNRKRIGMW